MVLLSKQKTIYITLIPFYYSKLKLYVYTLCLYSKFRRIRGYAFPS
jgi:hypothetical protein